MRRVAPEWLLVPVFVLPLGAAVALTLRVRSEFLARIEPFREDGASLARDWTQRDPGRVGGAAAQFARDVHIPRDDDGWVPFHAPRMSGFVRVAGARAPQATWEIASDRPAGLRPSALADANVRLAVESGREPSRLDAVDDGTVAFRELLESPDITRLRTAPLPASTKLYILRRAMPQHAEVDEATLESLASVERQAVRPLAPGVHELDGGGALVRVPDGPTLVYANSHELPPLGPYTLAADPDGDVVLAWFPATNSEVAWSGRLDAPLAGAWAFVLPHGTRWWESAAFTRWAGPVGLACAAFLLVPTALLLALRRRRRLDEARARFVNELAHDLRTPVTSLRLHAEMLAEHRVPQGEEARYLDVLGRETARLSSLLANLLDLSRLERGARAFDRAPLEVGEVIRDAVRDFELVHPRRAADVRLDTCDGLAAAADRTALARCLANLLDNAGKFTQAGTPIHVSAGRDGPGNVRIVVADEGAGISAADRTRLFRLYERGSAAATTGAPGTGLGLALVRDLVRGMGGSVRLVESERGAAFEIVLPEAAHG